MNIEEISTGTLYTFISDSGTNEWKEAYNKLTDIEFLENFFAENEGDLLNGYYRNRVTNVTDAVLMTISLAREFFDNVLLCCEEKRNLDTLFQNLENKSPFPALLILSKMKNKDKCNWLRIYGIRIDSGLYTITGGTIKLTHLMEERPHTQREFKKLNGYKNFLCREHVFDCDSLYELVENK